MLRLPQRILYSIAALATLAASGCGPQTRMPNLYHPGTADQQRMEAVVHDPYPLDDVGPPVVGGRPLGYQRPVLEVERARMFDQSRGIGPATAAPVIMGPPIVTSPPPPVYSQSLPGAPPPVVNAPPGTPPIVPDPYAGSPPAAMPYSPPAAAPYAVGPPVAAPYSAPPAAPPPAPYQYTPATPLEAFPSRSPY